MPTAHDTLPPQVSPPQVTLSDEPLHAVRGAEVAAVAVLARAGEDRTPDGDGDGTGDSSAVPLLGPGAEALADALGVDLLDVLEGARATGKAGELTSFPIPAGAPGAPDLREVLLVGVGEARPADLRRAGAALARATRRRTTVASSVAAVSDDEGLSTFVVGLTLGSFGFTMKTGGATEPPVERVVLTGLGAASQDALDRGRVLGRAGWLARTLATVPSNVKNPAWLAEQARQVADDHGLGYEVWDEQALAKDGFGGILGVGQASATPPRLIRLDYTPRGGRKAPRVVLVGKGITFDSGGLSIKPAEGMTTMKRDMTGGAVVIAVLGALRDLGCPLRVTGLVPAAENAVSGNALRPGDVIRHYGGRTTEVTNTDAEGRLVMGDALAYAVDRLDPAVVVDVATLTGAMKVALGQSMGGFFATHDELAVTISEAGLAADEPLWRFPLVDDYERHLESPVADSDNARVGPPGAILAALFLRHFVGETPWVHLDVASVGDSPKDAFEWTSGPTGFGARALLRWLTSPDPLKGI